MIGVSRSRLGNIIILKASNEKGTSIKMDLDATVVQALDAYRSGNLPRAQVLFKQVVCLYPSQVRAIQYLGGIAFRSNKVAVAHRLFKWAFNIDQKQEEVLVAYITILIQLRKFEHATIILSNFKKSANNHSKVKLLEKLFNDRKIAEVPNIKNQLQSAKKLIEEEKTNEALNLLDSLIREHLLSASAYFLRGYALLLKGLNTPAYMDLKKAIVLEPSQSPPLINLTVIYSTADKQVEALALCRMVNVIDPENTICWDNLGVILPKIAPLSYNSLLAGMFLKLLRKRTLVDPKDVADNIIDLLKKNSEFGTLLDQCQWKGDASFILQAINILTSHEVFLEIIELCPIPDVEVEEILTKLRKHLILEGDHFKNQSIIKFQTSLAMHCFTNEYIYRETKEETSKIRKIEKKIENELQNKISPSVFGVLCLASYRSLHSYTWCELIKNNEALKKVFKQQVKDYLDEKDIEKSIPRIKDITDKTSSAVSKQYQENPYPRWISTRIEKNTQTIPSLIKILKLNIKDQQYTTSSEPDVLIAGCGTGAHAISTASRLKNSKVTAIDLSRKSLSYAIRKTKEFNLDNINYFHGDILDVELLKQQFDIVESVGVIHHMDQPRIGLSKLIECLKPGGLLKLGLYSDLARSHVASIRKELSGSNRNFSKKNVEIIRTQIKRSRDPDLKRFLKSRDFYSTSALRDLIFHVQEHRFNLVQVKQILKESGLKFCGFQLQNLNQIIKEDGLVDIYDLDTWHELETAKPDTFIGMYQFWVQKV